MLSGVWRGVLHTTEGSTAQGAFGAYRSSGNLPHFTASAESGRFQIWQHLPIDQFATALMHPSGTVETNRLACVQIEVVGFAQQPVWPQVLIDGVRAWMVWVEEVCGVHPTAPQFLPYPASAGASPVRMSQSNWLTFGGWCGHMHVPSNDHGDPGAINISALLTRGASAAPAVTIGAAMARVPNPVAAHPLPGPNKSMFAVMAVDGAMYAYNGAPYCGGYNEHPDWWGGPSPTTNRAGVDFAWDDDGWGYTLYFDDGAHYAMRAQGH
jgi:hypothetical protein